MRVKTKNHVWLMAIIAILLTAFCATSFLGKPRLTASAAENENINTPLIPYIEGYTFVGWFFDENFLLPYDGRPITEDITLYAAFTINKYTVTFIVNDEVYATVTVDYGTTIDELLSLEETKSFSGIYTNSAMTEYAGDMIIKGNITLYALTDSESEPDNAPDNERTLEIIQVITICGIALCSVGIAAFFLIKHNKRKRKKEKSEIK